LSNELFEFGWRKCRARWIEACPADSLSGGAKLFLIEDVAFSGNVQTRGGYNPLVHRNLLNDFTRLKVGLESVRVFASQYGMLGQPASLQVISREDGSCYVGELLASWKAAVEEVNGFLQLVDIEDRQPVGWPEVYLSLSGRPATESRIPFKYLNSDEQRLRILRAREAMQSIATEKMGSLAQLQFRVDLQTGEKRFVAVPISLLGAIWVLAFRYACNYRPQTQTCSACGKTYSPLRITREGPTYCSDACRMKAYRLRRSQ